MNLYAALEPLILGLALLACCAACLRRFAPGVWRRLLGRRTPVTDAAASAACKSGCSTCGSCSPAGDKAAPIRIHAR